MFIKNGIRTSIWGCDKNVIIVFKYYYGNKLKFDVESYNNCKMNYKINLTHFWDKVY